MFSRVKPHLTPSTAIAIVALVFAATGGAFAATGGNGGSGAKASASVTPLAHAAKKKAAPKSTRGPAGPKGATGATGATGAAGPAGPTGPAGATGPAGTNGTNGVGTEGKEGKQGEPGKNGKNGNEGSPWTAGGVLPPEQTETGSWAFGQYPEELATGEFLYTALSFPIPLKESLAETHVHYIEKGGDEHGTGAPPTECGTPAGTAEDPKASPGNLCVYEAHNFKGMTFTYVKKSGSEVGGASTAGALLVMKGGEEANAWGTWAVTAPPA